ncbi:GNAT family N-acetyltransferase [Gillisia limnaea]|uniref:GCN5-related N-acetyltransferase n=1 Tax=Gillisia limnaea (strain DSM 15749 / LMG 21470 / R-8282) TaxID=865937 RepID=H2BVW2_GILLR|nr:GNAT family protein [Gillisia limnaea]EHQ01845.1 GCN5-related N-acetyltransferase [Gillisia limnaea DSM 15749]
MINEIYFKNFPELESERLSLRKLELTDAPEVQVIRSDEKVMIYMDSERQLTTQHSEKFISVKLKMYEERTGIFWAIIEKSTNKFMGDFAFFKIDGKNSRAEIGYTLKPEFWGNGFMQEAMFKIFDFGFNELNLHSLEANINPENKNSRAILTKMGFQKEAYFRENYYYNGEYLDSEIYSLLKSQFQKAEKNKE